MPFLQFCVCCNKILVKLKHYFYALEHWCIYDRVNVCKVCSKFPQVRRTIPLINFPSLLSFCAFCKLKARKLHFFHHFRPLSCAKKFDPGYKFDVGKWESMKKWDYQRLFLSFYTSVNFIVILCLSCLSTPPACTS